MTLSLIEGIVVLGIGVVLPLALGGPILAWVAATAAAFAAFQVRTGPAAALVVPFGIVAATVFASRIPVAMKRRTLAAWRAAGIAAAAEIVAPGYAVVAAISLFACTAAAPPLVATGFTTRAAVPQVGGAVLMTIGVWSTAVLQLRTALSRRWSAAAVLLATSGLSIWITMILAVAWAAGQHWNVPALSVEDMARTHGIVNAVGFCLAGLTARRLDAAAR